MATQLFCLNESIESSRIDGRILHRASTAINYTILSGGSAAVYGVLAGAGTTRGGGSVSVSVSTEAGPSAGLEFPAGTVPRLFVTPPIDQDVAVSGNVTFNGWANESAMNANAALNCRLVRIAPDGSFTEILKTTRTTELGTSAAAQNWSEAMGATFNLAKGDRIAIVWFIDDAGTMGAGFNCTLYWSGPTAGAQGDTYVTFTETFGFLAAPTGTQVFPTDTASAVDAGVDEREAWTSRGGGVATAVRNAQTAGWVDPGVQWTKTAGGTAVEWYTRPLQAFTLAAPVLVHVRARQSVSSVNGAIRCEIARVNEDGTGATVWESNGWGEGGSGELAVTESVGEFWIVGPDLAISDGQRLRIRFYLDDSQQAALANVGSATATLSYAGAAGATGDTFLTFSQTLTEFIQQDRVPVSTQMKQLLAH